MSRTRRQKQGLQCRAIRGAWCCARAQGLVPKLPAMDGLMNDNAAVRAAIVNAWLAGYRHGQRDGVQQR